MAYTMILTLNPAIEKSCVWIKSRPSENSVASNFNTIRWRDQRGQSIKELGGEVTSFWMGGGSPGDLLNTLLSGRPPV